MSPNHSSGSGAPPSRTPCPPAPPLAHPATPPRDVGTSCPTQQNQKSLALPTLDELLQMEPSHLLELFQSKAVGGGASTTTTTTHTTRTVAWMRPNNHQQQKHRLLLSLLNQPLTTEDEQGIAQLHSKVVTAFPDCNNNNRWILALAYAWGISAAQIRTIVAGSKNNSPSRKSSSPLRLGKTLPAAAATVDLGIPSIPTNTESGSKGQRFETTTAAAASALGSAENVPTNNNDDRGSNKSMAQQPRIETASLNKENNREPSTSNLDSSQRDGSASSGGRRRSGRSRAIPVRLRGEDMLVHVLWNDSDRYDEALDDHSVVESSHVRSGRPSRLSVESSLSYSSGDSSYRQSPEVWISWNGHKKSTRPVAKGKAVRKIKKLRNNEVAPRRSAGVKPESTLQNHSQEEGTDRGVGAKIDTSGRERRRSSIGHSDAAAVLVALMDSSETNRDVEGSSTLSPQGGRDAGESLALLDDTSGANSAEPSPNVSECPAGGGEIGDNGAKLMTPTVDSLGAARAKSSGQRSPEGIGDDCSRKSDRKRVPTDRFLGPILVKKKRDLEESDGAVPVVLDCSSSAPVPPKTTATKKTAKKKSKRNKRKTTTRTNRAAAAIASAAASAKWEMLRWHRTYDLLVAHYHRQGVCIDGEALEEWCDRQRFLKTTNALVRDRQNLLNEIGFPWTDLDAEWQRTWLRVSLAWPRKLEPALAQWVHNQKAACRDGMLTAWQVSKLSQLGFEWATTTVEAEVAGGRKAGHAVALQHSRISPSLVPNSHPFKNVPVVDVPDDVNAIERARHVLHAMTLERQLSLLERQSKVPPQAAARAGCTML